MIKQLCGAIARTLRPRSSIAALKRMLPSATYRRLLMTTPDRRMLFESTAVLFATPVSEIVEEVATRLGLSALPRISPLPKHRMFTIPSLERLQFAAAIPLCASSGVSGVVCVDPELMLAVLPEFEDLPVFIASWSDIKSALDSEPIDTVIESFHVFTQVVNFLIDELHRHQSDRCLLFIGNLASYRIPLNELEEARGVIHENAKKELQIGLEEFIRRNKKFIYLQTGEEYQFTYSAEEFEIKKVHDAHHSACEVEFGRGQINEAQQNPTQTVLLVDDNATFARVLDRFLAKEGILTHYSPNGKDALETLRNRIPVPSVIVCDIHMPVMNGFEFVRALRTEEGFKHMPLLMLTSDGDVEAEITLLSYGVEAFIGKNEDPRILCMHVKRILDRFSQKAA